MSTRIRAAWLRLPRALRFFIRDATLGAAAAIIALNLPLEVFLGAAKSTDAATALAVVIGSAIGRPAIESFMRNVIPAAIDWIRRTFSEPEDVPPA